MNKIIVLTYFFVSFFQVQAQESTPVAIEKLRTERARDLGIPFDGEPGLLNAITDVPGVTVGYATIIKDSPKIARTGVSAIFPRGMKFFF